MTGVALPPELVSLVHHVELNKAGWWDKAIQQLVVATVWLSEGSPTEEATAQQLEEHFAVKVDSPTLRGEIDALCDAGTLVRLPAGALKISETALADFLAALEEAVECQNAAKARFASILEAKCPLLDSEDTWTSFNNDCLVPMVREMGARTYEMLGGRFSGVAATATVSTYLESCAEETRVGLREGIVEFLDPKDAEVRSYVLRLLNAYFFVAAGSLDKEHVNALADITGTEYELSIFVDTNFLFSMLGIHENPSNQAAESLMTLAASLPGKVSVSFYVAPITTDEARGVLVATNEDLKGLRLWANLAAAALESGLSGLATRFVQESRRATGAMSPDDFFGPYITDLVRAARASGVELYNQKLDSYRTDQRVIDDISDQLEFQRSRPGVRAKGYEQVEHDMVLWHWVSDLRPAVVESLFDAKYCIVTVDYRFLAFDRFKGGSPPNSVPICVHPASLLQMLQFWIPRTAAFEQGILGALRVPFLFQEFDPVAEKTTIRILEVLSRFENASDLSHDTVRSILVNESLRQRLAGEATSEGQIELIRECLADETVALRSELATQQARSAELAKRLQETEYEMRDKEDARQRERERGRFVLRWAGLPLMVLAAVLVGVFLPLAFLLTPRVWPLAALCAVAGLAGWLTAAERRGKADETLASWRPVRVLQGLRAWLLAALGAVAASVVGAGIWDWVSR